MLVPLSGCGPLGLTPWPRVKAICRALVPLIVVPKREVWVIAVDSDVADNDCALRVLWIKDFC